MLEEGGYWTASDFTEDEAEMVPRVPGHPGSGALPRESTWTGGTVLLGWSGRCSIRKRGAIGEFQARD